MLKFFVNLEFFLRAVTNAFRIFFLKPVKQTHNEDQETDKQKFARIPIGIYPLQFFVTQFQMIHNMQKEQNEALRELLNAIKSQNEVIKRFFNILSPEKIDKTDQP